MATLTVAICKFVLISSIKKWQTSTREHIITIKTPMSQSSSCLLTCGCGLGLHAWCKHRHISNAATPLESVWRYISQARLVVDIDYWSIFVTEKYIVLQQHEGKLQYALWKRPKAKPVLLLTSTRSPTFTRVVIATVLAVQCCFGWAWVCLCILALWHVWITSFVRVFMVIGWIAMCIIIIKMPSMSFRSFHSSCESL